MQIGQSSQRAFINDMRPTDQPFLASMYDFTPWFNAWSEGVQNDEALRMMEFCNRNSPTYGAMNAIKMHYLFGQGLWADPATNKGSARAVKAFNEWMNGRNSLGNLRSVEFQQMTMDYVAFGHLFAQFIRWSEMGADWFEIFHQQSWNTRLSKADKDERVTSVKISKNFLTKTRLQNMPPNMTEIPLYGVDPEGKVLADGNSVCMVQIKDYQPSFEWYGVPGGVMALPDAFLEYTCNASWQDMLKSGFFPSTIAQFVDAPASAPELRRFNQEMRDEFTGDGNFGKLLVQALTSKEEFAQISTVTPEYPRDFIDLKNQCRDAIILAHRVPTSLSGVQVAGKLGSTKEIRDAYDLYYSTVIKPTADKIAREFTEILSPYFGGIELSFRQNPPIGDYIPMTNNMFLQSRGLPLLPLPLGDQLYVAL
jgi:hypothetical protein